MTSAIVWMARLTVCCALLACSRTGRGAASSASVSASQPGVEVDAGELMGSWVEFWAISGRANTQSYTFGEDGSFEWRAAPDAAPGGPTLRSGHYRVEGGALILSIAREEPAARAAHSGDERLPIGACPPDQEARSMDASYRCLSFNGRAFWRRPR